MPTGYRHVRDDVIYPEDEFELTEDGRIPIPYRRTAKYQDGNTIDWLHEEGIERERNHALQSQAGIRGVLLPALESSRMWFIVIMTGMGIGIAGAWLDVLVKWCVV
jgi:chloride channel 3/4/5